MRKVLTLLVLLALAGLALSQWFRVRDLEHQIAAAQTASKTNSHPDSQSDELEKLRIENNRLREQAAEVYKLRGEVSLLRGQQQNPSRPETNGKSNEVATAATLWLERVNTLKTALNRMPDKITPELQLLSEVDWLDATKDADLSTDDSIREALGKLRNKGKEAFISQTRKALLAYTQANDGMLPPDMQSLKSFYEQPPEDALLQRYQMAQQGKLTDHNWTVVTEIAMPVDDEYETLHQFGITSEETVHANLVEEQVHNAAREFAKSNGGESPQNPKQINSLLKLPIPDAKIEKYLKTFKPGKP